MSSKRKIALPSLALQEVEGPASKRRKLPEATKETADGTTKTGLALLERLKNARDKQNWPIATHFLTLPDRKKIPQYYDEIGLPMALDIIEGKLQRREYPTMTKLESDLRRMIGNAKSFNQKSSQVFSDAEKIRKIISAFMEQNNPAYKTGDYQPSSTPVPEGWREKLKKEISQVKDVDEESAPEEGGNGTRSGRRSGRSAAPSSTVAINGRRVSTTPAVQEAEGAGETFEGKTFQQAQDKIIIEMINLKDEDNQLISANFINLPSRALLDYYRVIKHPVSLKSVQKDVRGFKGRDQPIGATLLKSWQAFEDKVSYVWRNAREYNEDESLIAQLAGQLESYFYRRLEEAKSAVAEPPQPKVKLTMKAAQETPKITLKFGAQKTSGSAGPSVDDEAPKRQQELVKAGANGQESDAADGLSQPAPRTSSDGSSSQPLPVLGRPSHEDAPRSGSGEPSTAMNGIKREVSHGHSPALGTVQTNGTAVMPAPVQSSTRLPSGSPHPAGINGTVHGSHSSATSVNSRLRQPGKDVSDALITNLNISTHPDLNLPQRFNLDMPASSTQTQQSITITLTRQQWSLLISPTLSSTIMHRPSRLFVTCNNRRLSGLPQQELDQRRPIYEHKLMPGTNTIEVEVIAGLPRGAPKTGSGPEIELEKYTVFVHYMQG